MLMHISQKGLKMVMLCHPMVTMATTWCTAESSSTSIKSAPIKHRWQVHSLHTRGEGNKQQRNTNSCNPWVMDGWQPPGTYLLNTKNIINKNKVLWTLSLIGFTYQPTMDRVPFMLKVHSTHANSHSPQRHMILTNLLFNDFYLVCSNLFHQ